MRNKKIFIGRGGGGGEVVQKTFGLIPRVDVKFRDIFLADCSSACKYFKEFLCVAIVALVSGLSKKHTFRKTKTNTMG